MPWSRRRFLSFLGASSATALAGPLLGACLPGRGVPFEPLAPSDADQLVLASGFHYDMLLSEGQAINPRGDRFGINNDFLAFWPTPGQPDEARLWVNHEYPVPLFDSGRLLRRAETRAQADRMMASVGASFVRIRREGSRWSFVPDGGNLRLDANTPMPLVAPRPIAGGLLAKGTMGNCAGGTTPWGTILSCEENHHDYFGEVSRRGRRTIRERGFQWQKFYDRDPRHYGWVVEFDPRTGQARKHTALGRYSHESATVVEASDGRPVVYGGDDAYGGCLYKFVGDRPHSLESGRLYAANLQAGRWELLDVARPELRPYFADQLEVLIHARESAWRCGGTRLDRPEDIEIDPRGGHVYVALTNNVKKLNYYGSILRVQERGGDHRALNFTARTFLSGGTRTGFACPDNMVFDRQGNLWLTSDISEGYVRSRPYATFKNNGLFYIPLRGRAAGRVFQVASAPRDAEFTGPCFAPDGRTLFLSVQHPGIGSASVAELNSHWPDGGESLPRSAVVAISGQALTELTAG